MVEPSNNDDGELPSKNTGGDSFSLLMALLQNWLQRFTLLRALVLAETRLNLRAVALLVGVAFGLILLVGGLWLTLLVALGMVVYWYCHSVLLAMAAVVAVQGLIIVWLVRGAGRVGGQMGYRRSRAAVTDILTFSTRNSPPMNPSMNNSCASDNGNCQPSDVDRANVDRTMADADGSASHTT